MRKNKKSCSISEFCRNNNFRTLEFYKMLSRHPELARKMKANSAGERVLDEEAMMTARAILRKEKIRQTENSLFIQRNEMIAAAVFKALGREYMPGDEVRISEYLAGCDDFKIYMSHHQKRLSEFRAYEKKSVKSQQTVVK